VLIYTDIFVNLNINIKTKNILGAIMTDTKVEYIVDEKGQKKAVLVPIEDYEELLEDIQDLAVIAERKEEPTISFDEIKKKLKKDGVL